MSTIERQKIVLADYKHFDGLHWDTGPIRNALDYQGVIAPHNNKPLTEAMLFGISGGIVAGYFTFEYKGFDPSLPFLTRNTFDPMQAIIKRLGIPTQVKQTDNPEKAVKNLLDTLEAGKPALVWADICTLEYSNLPSGNEMQLVVPIIAYGYDGDTAYIADRARVPLTTTAKNLAAARARVKKEKHRVMTLDAPDMSKLPAAIKDSIRYCINSMLGPAPLAPMKGKYGLDAFTRWADLLADSKSKNSWAKAFPPGVKMYSMLTSAYRYINLASMSDSSASRGLYSIFLDEASLVLNQSALQEVAKLYRAAGTLWAELSNALLPHSVPLFKETRDLLSQENRLFIEKGGDSLAERKEISLRLKAIRDEMAASFPLNDTEADALRQNLRECILKLREAEARAATALQEGMQ